MACKWGHVNGVRLDYFSIGSLLGLPFGLGAARLPVNSSTFLRKRSLPSTHALLVFSRIVSMSASHAAERNSCL